MPAQSPPEGLSPGTITDPVLRRAGLPRAVQSLVEAVVQDAIGPARSPDPEALREAVAVMNRRLRMMPTFLGTPMMGASLVFDWSGLLFAGSRFHRQQPDRRGRQLRWWRNAPLGFLRDFMDFYGKMGVFAYFSELEEREKAGEHGNVEAGGENHGR